MPLDQLAGPVSSGIEPDSEIDLSSEVLRYEDYVDVSTNGTMLAVRGGGRDAYLNKAIAIVNTDGTASFTDLTDPAQVAATSPAWSPDDSTIAFVQQPTSETSDPNSVLERRIWLMDADGSNKRRLTNAATWEEYPQWSADGRYILYVAPAPANSPSTKGEPRDAALVLRDLSDDSETTPVPVLAYEINSIEVGIWYYGHFDWAQVFDWWQSAP